MIKITGWTPQELDSAPAHLTDWILALANAEAQAEAEAMKKAAH